ncbi:MAG: EpsG family protein [Flavobacterium sp.]|nr:EpsG family protein [Flavobacterium sp.]
MGTRPLSGKYFGDMRTYSIRYLGYAEGEPVFLGKDVVFDYFMKFCSSIMTVEVFFFLCATLYVVPLYLAVKKTFKEYWFYAFLMLVVSMSFWAYGVNGIRNGLATSFFIYAITRDKLLYKVLWLILGAAMHQSLLIPILALIVVTRVPKPSLHFKVWLAAIPLSLVLGSFWESFFLNIGLFETERAEAYLSGSDTYDEQFSRTGFRWDFLIYSATGIFAGWYFAIKRKFDDKLYLQIFNVYLLVNAFWILVIRASFSNRFAYLSWFLLGLVIIYPMLKNRFFKDQHNIMAKVILAYFLLTFLLNVIL